MRALTVEPGVEASAGLSDVAEPSVAEGELLLESLAVGVCGTDAEIVEGHYGEAPPGSPTLVLGHEAIGRVLEAPAGGPFAEGDLVVPIVRRPDPVPCPSCAVGEWDMCRNGRYTEHGIKGLHGFARERYALDPSYAVAVPPALGDLGVLVEPASVVAKAWEQIERIGARSSWTPRTVLVTGAGPIGLLAALLASQRGFDVHVLDRVTEGPKPALVADLGATYHTSSVEEAGPTPDIIVECTGVGALVVDTAHAAGPTGIVCLAGLGGRGRTIAIDAGALNRELVLDNAVLFGSVNANRRHYAAAVDALARADRSWLDRLVTRRVDLADWKVALEQEPDDVKVVLEVAARP